MKTYSHLIGCILLVASSATAGARAATETQDGTSSEAPLTKLDAAELQVRLGWAKLYLAELDKNDRVMGALGVPVEVSPARTAYAIGVTAVNGTLVGATYALAQTEVKKTLKAHAHHKAVMSMPEVKRYRLRNGEYATKIKEYQGAAKLGLMPVGSAPTAELIEGVQKAIDLNTKIINKYHVSTRVPMLRRVALGAGVTFGIGLAATLIYDGVRTWLQVRHNGEEVEQQKKDLRDFIAYAEDRLAHADTKSAR